MSLRALIKDLTPPLLLRLARRRDGRRYESYAAALADCPTDYDDPDLNRFRMERLKANLAEPADLAEDNLQPFYWLLKVAAFAASRDGPVSILDYGGGCGEYGFILRRNLDAEIDYRVVETPSLAKLCAADPAFGPIRFVDDIPDAIDIFFTSGTLQCVPDPEAVLRTGFGAARKFVVLGRNDFTSGRPVYHVQRSRLGDNGAGRRLPEGDFSPNRPIHYPHGSVPLAMVTGIAESLGWTQLAAIGNDSGVYGSSGSFGRDLIFHR